MGVYKEEKEALLRVSGIADAHWLPARTCKLKIYRALGTEKATVKAVYESDKAGNAKAQEMLKHAGEYIGIAIANVMDLFDPQKVTLNGELINAGDMLLDPLKEVVTPHSRSFSDLSYEIKVSEIGLEASALGAALLPLRGFFEVENIKL